MDFETWAHMHKEYLTVNILSVDMKNMTVHYRYKDKEWTSHATIFFHNVSNGNYVVGNPSMVKDMYNKLMQAKQTGTNESKINYREIQKSMDADESKKFKAEQQKYIKYYNSLDESERYVENQTARYRHYMLAN